MKKLLTLLILTILLAGCATTSNQSFLDEKIKCKKLAEEKIKAIEKGFTIDNLLTAKYTEIEYSQNLDTCIMSYIKSNKIYDGTYSYELIIRDLLTEKILAYYSYNDEAWDEEKSDAFHEKEKLYFGEDAE